MSWEEVEQIRNTGQLNTKPGTEGEKGSGLELTISKQFIEKHGGKMTVRSSLGKGSILGFIIPLKKQLKTINSVDYICFSLPLYHGKLLFRMIQMVAVPELQLPAKAFVKIAEDRLVLGLYTE